MSDSQSRERLRKEFEKVKFQGARFLVLADSPPAAPVQAAATGMMYAWGALLCHFGHLTTAEYSSILETPELTGAKYASVRQYFYKLPWGLLSALNGNIQSARELLDRSVYGMRAAKDKIIENVTMFRHSNGKGAPEPLLLVGGPGTGKTFLCSTVSEALGTAFCKLTLAGSHDVSVLKGSSAHWTNGEPGLITKEFARCGCLNPVFLFDEIDKTGGSSAGMVSHVLTEMFDTNQNFAVRDNFFDFTFDMSKVIFMATANEKEMIPAHILDRCAIIEIPDYTVDERRVIVSEYLPREVARSAGFNFGITMSENVVNRLARMPSLRTAKRVLRSHVLKAIEPLEVGGFETVFVSDFNEGVLNMDSGKPSIGFNAGR
jgi:ATP-dependent Lon protease